MTLCNSTEDKGVINLCLKLNLICLLPLYGTEHARKKKREREPERLSCIKGSKLGSFRVKRASERRLSL